jgi:hypothetical protein
VHWKYPPALLVFTIGRADQVELPGATTSPWQATKWFCGKETFESFMLDDDRRKGQLDAALPVQLFASTTSSAGKYSNCV